MSQENKGRTMIGTRAPITQPRPGQVPGSVTRGPQEPTIMPTGPTGPTGAPPSRVPVNAAPMPVPAQTAPPVTPSTPTIAAPMSRPASGTPTVAMRAYPAPAPTPGGLSPGGMARGGMLPSGVAPGGTDAGPYGTGHGGAMPAGSEPDVFVGQELCGYTIRRKLAEGGMGVVYEGVHGRIGRIGAIKVLKLEFCRSEDVVERFYQEARAVNAIQHENIVDIYDFGRDPYGRVFFVMEYLEGEPLSTRIRRGALAWGEALPILDQTLRALKAAHDKGFVHRDLKPDNIWLKYVDGRVQVKLLDFGIAKLVGSESPKEKLTQTGSVIGTPHYMSPEQINGARDIDHRTDIYAMGVITYEMFAGVTPFSGDTLQAIMTGHLFKEPPRLADIPSSLGVPPPIAEIVDRMLVKDPAGRYDSVTDVLSDLYDVSRNQWPTHAEMLNRVRPTRVLPPVAPQAALPRKAGSRALAIGSALAVVGLAAAGIAIWKSQQEPPVTKIVAPAPPPVKVENPAPPPKPPIDYDAVRKDAQTTLHASLRETEPTTRIQGSDMLGKIKDQPSVPVLTELTEKDPDDAVRGHVAEALGQIGAAQTRGLLGKLEAAAAPPLKVWYASALARLGDPGAAKRLLGYARSKDLAVSFKAGLTLADVSRPGDKKTIAALRALAAHEAELNQLTPYAGALILTRMAALHDAEARKVLYALLDNDSEGARLAAAEGLAKLGDDAGKKVLRDVLANHSSPNRLVAAVAQIPLGEYGGLAVIREKLDDKDPGRRRLAARALGDIGDPGSLDELLKLASDRDWTVRIAAAGAIVAIVGLDPKVLAQASVDWTKDALDSQDLAVRKAAAGVLADIPAKEAVPLLAKAIADPDASVRLAATRSAGKIKTAEAAGKVAVALKAEADPKVKEQAVKALGEIGTVAGPAAHDTLAQLSNEPGRLGVLAAGSLIAVGDTAGEAKLEAAVGNHEVGIRLAAVEAASSAGNAVVVPTLKIGIGDKVFEIRFAAAEGLASFITEKAAALPVLTAALDNKDAGVFGRAIAALTRLGEKIKDTVRTPADMLDSIDPRQRLAVVPAVRALAVAEAVPLLRRLVADADQEVRHAGVDAIEDIAVKDKDQAIKLYKPLVNDADPVVRSKALGQLSRIAPPLRQPTQIAQATPPTPAAPPPPMPTLDPKVKEASDAANAAAAEARQAADAVEAQIAELGKTTAARTRDDATLDHVKELRAGFGAAAAKLDTVAEKAEATAKTVEVTAAASPSDEASKLVAEARELAQHAREAATAARGKLPAAEQQADGFIKDETGDPQNQIDLAGFNINNRNYAAAKANLDKARKLLQKTDDHNPNLDDLYSQVFLGLAQATQDPSARSKLLQRAADACQRFLKVGAGVKAAEAKERLAQINGEIEKSGAQ